MRLFGLVFLFLLLTVVMCQDEEESELPVEESEYSGDHSYNQEGGEVPAENSEDLGSSNSGVLPSIGHLASGYNIFKGNPHNTEGSIDPGIMVSGKIFDLRYDQKRMTSDQKWEIPDKVQADPTYACMMNGKTTTIDTMQKYMESLSVSVKVSVSSFMASFSASTSYSEVFERLNSKSDVFVSVVGQCSVYFAGFNSLEHPDFTDTFRDAVNNLPNEYNDQTASSFFEFFDIFGTHFFERIEFGARYGVQTRSTTEQWSTMKKNRLDIATAASYGALVEVKVELQTSTEKQMAESFRQNVETVQKFSLGTPPPVSGNNQEWQRDTLSSDTLYPIVTSLKPLYNLLKNWKAAPEEWAQKYEAMKTAASQYCEKTLIDQSATKCSTGQTKLQKGTCALCKNSCGNKYHRQGGALSLTLQWPNYFRNYRSYCAEGYGKNEDGLSSGMHLCCEPHMDDPDLPALSLCHLQCGGKWPVSMGVIEPRNDNGAIKLYNDEVSNFFAGRGPDCEEYQSPMQLDPLERDIHLCSPQENTGCKLCSSCGSGFPYEKGLMSDDCKDAQYFQHFGYKCEQPMDSHVFGDGIRLCCSSDY